MCLRAWTGPAGKGAGFGSTKGGGGVPPPPSEGGGCPPPPYSPPNCRTPLGVTHWLAPAPVPTTQTGAGGSQSRPDSLPRFSTAWARPWPHGRMGVWVFFVVTPLSPGGPPGVRRAAYGLPDPEHIIPQAHSLPSSKRVGWGETRSLGSSRLTLFDPRTPRALEVTVGPRDAQGG